ncbi:MAG: transcriptional regulator, partial [Solirubrobacteraceae bacterium]
QDTRAHRLRLARTCYDHLAGRLGVALMGAMLNAGQITGGDGRFHPDRAGEDRLSAAGRDLDYELTGEGQAFLGRLGVVLPPRRKPVGYCVDWTEQRHHLAGGAGRGLLDRMLQLDWIRRAEADRAVAVTEAGRRGLARHFELQWPPQKR